MDESALLSQSQFSAQISSNMHHYNNAERADKYIMQGAVGGNGAASQSTYTERFPSRNPLDFRTLERFHCELRRSGQFYSSCHESGSGRNHRIIIEKALLCRVVEDRSSTSSRAFGRTLVVNHFLHSPIHGIHDGKLRIDVTIYFQGNTNDK